MVASPQIRPSVHKEARQERKGASPKRTEGLLGRKDARNEAV